MTVADLVNRTCTITPRAGSPVETVCELQQRQRDDDLSRWLVVFLPGTAIESGDTVTVDDRDYQIVGEPWEARNPLTQTASHIEATARRIGIGLANARLLAVLGAGQAANYGRPATAGAAVWEGTAPALLREERFERPDELADDVIRTTLTIALRTDAGGTLPLPIAPGLTVRYEHHGDEHERRVERVTDDEVDGVTRIWMEDA